MAAPTVAKRRAGLLLLFISSNDGSRDRKALRTGRHPGMAKIGAIASGGCSPPF